MHENGGIIKKIENKILSTHEKNIILTVEHYYYYVIVESPVGPVVLGGTKTPTGGSKYMLCIFLLPLSYVLEKNLSTKNSKDLHLTFIGLSLNWYYVEIFFFCK